MMSGMQPSLTDTLCTQCGLCCDGSLFADVELAGCAEATALEILGLEIESGDADGGLLSQPCVALQGTRCRIYAHRPQCCRTFECGLLQDTRNGAVSVDRALLHIADAHHRIAQVKTLISQLGHRDARLPLKERCAEALSRDVGADPEAQRKQAELEAAMSGVETLILNTFMGGGANQAVAGSDRDVS